MTSASNTPREVPRLLVVDDEPLVGQALARLLGRQGYEVVVVEDAASARAAVATSVFDAALVDRCLGPTDGIALADELRDLAPDLKCALMSGFDPPQGGTEALWVCKPCPPETLLPIVEQLTRMA